METCPEGAGDLDDRADAQDCLVEGQDDLCGSSVAVAPAAGDVDSSTACASCGACPGRSLTAARTVNIAGPATSGNGLRESLSRVVTAATTSKEPGTDRERPTTSAAPRRPAHQVRPLGLVGVAAGPVAVVAVGSLAGSPAAGGGDTNWGAGCSGSSWPAS